MDLATQLEQTYSLIQYVLGQMDLPDWSKYSPYFLIAGAILIIIFIVKKFIDHKRRVYEYIENGVCVRVDFPPMGNRVDKLSEIFNLLHKELQILFNNKCYFSIELLAKQDSSTLFLFLPRAAYQHLASTLKKSCELKLMTESRERFLDNLGENVAGFELELNKDFVFPLLLTKSEDFHKVLTENEWLFLQILCRPIGDKWIKVLTRYKDDLSRGREPKGQTGCSGGCFGVTLPFFSFLADTLTSLIHGGGTSKTDGSKVKLSEIQKQKLELVEKKQDGVGFESLARVCMAGSDMDRTYLLLDKFLDLTSREEGEGNSFAVTKMHKKVKSSFENDLLLANMSKSCVDVLTINEILCLLEVFM